MAYMIGDEGPYPNLPGEYCGNETSLSPKYEQHTRGRPRPTRSQSISELEAKGVHGLYLNRPLLSYTCHPNYREVPTPPELRKPEPNGE